jgi:Uma2 family endonuclease
VALVGVDRTARPGHAASLPYPRRLRTSHGRSYEQIVTTPPLICIEILSKDDSFASIVDRLDNYVSMGVSNVWVIDPHKRRAYTYSAAGTTEAVNGELRVADTNISVPLASIFES